MAAHVFQASDMRDFLTPTCLILCVIFCIANFALFCMTHGIHNLSSGILCAFTTYLLLKNT